MAFVIPSIACLVRQYTVRFGEPTCPICDDILITAPPRSRRSGACNIFRTAACATRNAERTFNPRILSKFSSDTSTKASRNIHARIVEKNIEAFDPIDFGTDSRAIGDIADNYFCPPARVRNTARNFFELAASPTQ